MLNKRKIAVIGAGTLGEALISGLLEARALPRGAITATARHKSRIDTVRERYGVRVTLDNAEAVKRSDTVIVAVKPKMLEHVLAEIAPYLDRNKLLMPVVASASTNYIQRALGGARAAIVRAMPNTPCLSKEGMTAICAGPGAGKSHMARARAIFESVGRCLEVEEEYMDAITGLSASGPAFIYIVIESLAEGGVKVGLPRALATELAAQTVLGSARMVLDTREHPALLKDMVTTPAGCTMDGILELEEGGLRVTLIKAIVRAAQRAKELLNE